MTESEASGRHALRSGDSRQGWLLHPLRVVRHLAAQHDLLRQLTRREAAARYRGSWLGVLWSLIEPLLLFVLYMFVFTVVFEIRWGTAAEGRSAYGLNLFAGLVVYNLLSETLVASPTLILQHRHFVKRAIFPLEVLPLTRFLANALHAAFGFAILLVAVVVVQRHLPVTVLLAPLVLLPLVLLTVGLSYFAAALGVFVRDLSVVVRLIALSLLFLSPVFYPSTRLPASLQALMAFNPLAHTIEDFRRITLRGELPDGLALALLLVFSLAAAVAGFAWFMRSKHAFADVV